MPLPIGQRFLHQYALPSTDLDAGGGQSGRPTLTVLVTGATGFIGGKLAVALRDCGCKVRALVRTGSAGKLPEGITPVFCDLTRPVGLADALNEVTVVYHLAAVRDQWGVPYQDYHKVNVEGTEALLKAASVASVSRFVYCSSVGIAEYPGQLDADETLPHRWDRSKHNYHHTKALAEQMTLNYARGGGVATTVLRPCITFGPGDTWGMVTRMLAMLDRRRYVVAGAGQNHIHLAYVDDIVQGFLLAGEHERAIGQVYILAGPEPIRMADLIAKMCTLLQVPAPSWHIPVPLLRAVGGLLEMAYAVKNRLGVEAWGQAPIVTRSKVNTVTLDSGFSTAKAKNEIGYRPQVNIDEGLRRAIGWYRDYNLG